MTLSHRIKTIFSHVSEEIDAIIIKNASSPFIDSTFFYATRLKKGLFEGCSLLLYPNGSHHLLVSTLEQPLVPSSLTSSVFSSKQEYKEKLQQLLTGHHKIGINAASLLHQDYTELQKLLPHKEFISVSTAIQTSRTIKDEEEIKTIRKACAIADKVMTQIPSFFSEPITEDQLAAEIDHSLKQYGASAPAFETISSFGQNTAKPHYTSGKKLIEPGDFIICDFGATVHHYHSDMTRTFVYGSPTKKQQQIHHTVLSAQKQALQAIKPGVKANYIHQKARETIDASEYKGYFIHSTGHGLGLEVHDPGIGFAPNYETVLQPGMVLTVEPGIYIPEIGGVRIEDDIVVSPDGYIQLTTSPKKLIEIPID